MAALERILVPVDLSACSMRALNYALWLAGEHGAQLDVLYVWHSSVAATPSPFRTDAISFGEAALDYNIGEARLELETFLSGIETDRKPMRRADVVEGGPLDAILERAKSGAYDLIVMGTHGRTGLARVTLGSVAERVVRQAPCPVLTVGGSNAEKEWEKKK
ncbi:MAG: universal stress protein [Deltaproteobacteria bacterium]|nr:universal stress protein [Deltaproteobacteria bacterium]